MVTRKLILFLAFVAAGFGQSISPAPGGGASPAGSDTQVQFNNAGSFGASANFTWDNSSALAFIMGRVVDTLTTTGNFQSSLDSEVTYGGNHNSSDALYLLVDLNGHTVTQAQVMNVDSLGATGGGGCTFCYGIWVNDQTVGTNPRAIKTGLGPVELGDALLSLGVSFINLPSPIAGMQIYCTDCQPTTVAANVVTNVVCKSGGTGSTAMYLNGAWTCQSYH